MWLKHWMTAASVSQSSNLIVHTTNMKTESVTRIISVCVLQDRATFRRLVVKNNAKKRRMYECFIESVPLLKSLEVRKWLYIYSIARHVFSGSVKECQVTLRKNLRMMRPKEMHIISNTYPSFYLIDFWEDEDCWCAGCKIISGWRADDYAGELYSCPKK